MSGSRTDMESGVRELRPDELRWICPSSTDGGFSDVPPAVGLVGQDRAARAIRFGLEIESPGYHIYVAGYPGTGRTTAVRDLIRSVAPRRTPALKDRAYVANFKEPDRPALLIFPAGQGSRFRDDVHAMVNGLKQQIPEALKSDPSKRARAEAEKRYRSAVAELAKGFESRAKEHGFEMGTVSLDPAFPSNLRMVLEGPSPSPAGAAAAADPAADNGRRQETVREDLKTTLLAARDMSREFHAEMERIDRAAVSDLVAPLIRNLEAAFPCAAAHLRTLGEAIVRDMNLFRAAGEPDGLGDLGLGIAPASPSSADPFLKFRVNLIQDNAGNTECPVVFEENPTLANLIGLIELELHSFGAVRASFMNIKGGSLLRADGGFLVLRASDVLSRPGAWSALKRVLKDGKLEIGVSESLWLPGVVTVKPEPMDVRVKVVLIGDPFLHELLWRFDEDFPGTFKVKADFDSEMKAGPESLRQFASVLSKVRRAEGLPAPEDGAVREILEEGMRRTGRGGRLTTRFSEAADILREAAYWARKEASPRVTAGHVRMALEEQKNRHRLLEERLGDLIDENVLRVDVIGEQTGQVNGLSVYDLGRHSFARPTRITASVSVGRAGVLSVERESGLSGRTHDKGVLTLTGFLRERFGQEYPLSLSASIAFEQSYGPVEGDSASLGELAALLSALSGIPASQSVAVTGSVDQKGNLQAVGGVTEKVEGFFRVCERRGLTGSQGVLIPEASARDLMLASEVVDAVRLGRFHVWTARTVDDALPLILGAPSGERDPEGRYPSGSVNRRVDQKLREFAESLARFGGPGPLPQF